MKALVILDQIGNVDRAEPAAGDREHVEPHAKLPADDVDKLRLAAMGLKKISFRHPVRPTLSPIASHARPSVS